MTFTLAAILLALAPLALLVGLLSVGWYPGERALESIRRWFEPDAPRAPTPGRPRLALRLSGARGSALLARNLAGRAPPATCRPRTLEL